MKLGLGRKLLRISFYAWLLKCKLSLIMEGHIGLSRTVSMLPKSHIVAILKRFGANIGDNCDIDIGLLLHRVRLPLKNLTIGNNVHIGHNTLIDLTCQVKIGDDSAIGSNSMFITHAGDWTFDRSDEYETKGDIQIDKAVIIYSGCIITPGVHIYSYARIAANSTVLENIPKFAFAAGSPAKVKKYRHELFNTKQ